MRTTLLGLALLLPVAVPAAAQVPRDPAALFAEADKDHDGRISRAEFQATRLAQFDRLDRNGDGVISRDDFGRLFAIRPQAAARIEPLLAEADLNHDGKVTREELARAPSMLFEAADTNHDGYVDRAELTAARARWRAMPGR